MQARLDEFLQLYSSHQARMYAYVLTLLPRWSDADDVMQKCNVVLWKKFDSYESGTNFFGWACQIAHLEVKDFRKRCAREKLLFSDEFLDAVAAEENHMAPELANRLEALQQCVEKLPRVQREMLRIRYEESSDVERVAEQTNRTAAAIYKTLTRIRKTLFDCVTLRLESGAA